MRRFFITVLFLGLMLGSARAEWNKALPANSSSPSDIAYLQGVNNNATEALLANYKQGAVISYVSTSAISVSAGSVTCMNVAGDTKRFRQNTAAVSAAAADIDIGGSFIASTTYNVFAVADAVATTFTIKLSSAAAPSGVTYYQKLGSFYSDASSNIYGVKNDGTKQRGDWVSKSANVIYQATTDGEVVAIAYTGGYGGSISGYTDSSTTPTTLRQYVTRTPQITNEWYSISFPVKSRDYYEVTTSLWTGTVYFSPDEGG